MSAYELAGAYMMYGDGGRFTTLHSYTSVEDYQGNVILEKDITTVQAISEETAYIMNRLLKGVLTDSGGTAYGMSANAAGMDSVGKTGTTNNNTDVWFVGLTPYYVSAFWYGYDENEPMSSYVPRTGKHPGANAWREIMNTVQADSEKYPVISFDVPENVVTEKFCTISGDLAAAGCPTQVGYYKKDVMPGTCPGGHAATE
jgi:penicillin-binding protein 1A